MFIHSLPYPSWACLFSVFFHTVATFCVMSLVRCSCPQSKQHCLRQLPSHNRHPSVLLCYLNNRYWSWILEKYWENLYTDHFFKHMAPDKFDVTTSQTDCETKHENDRNSLIGSVNTNLEISSDFALHWICRAIFQVKRQYGLQLIALHWHYGRPFCHINLNNFSFILVFPKHNSY